MVAPNQPVQPKFSLGQVVATPGALEALRESGESVEKVLSRHVSGDWGDLDPEDKRANEQAVGHGLRILSSYATSKGEIVWVITEADRSVTTILLPDEY